MAELMDYVGVMADQIGPRPVSTEEEHQTSLYIAQELTDDGLDVDVDEFATPTGTRWPYAIAFVATILGSLVSGAGIFVPGISLTMFVLGIVLIAIGFFIYYTEFNNKPVLSKMRAGGVSQNVVARYVPSSVRREQRRRKVIVVAHVDTVRAELEAAPALIKHTALLRKIVYYAMVGIAVLTVVRLLPIPWPSVVDTVLWVISLVGCVYLLAATVCIVARRFTPYVSGGNDNASAGAVLLGVAKRLVDPEERERHAARRRAEAESREASRMPDAREAGQSAEASAPDAAGAARAPEAAPTQTFSPVDEDASQSRPVLHDVQAAYDAGVVPEGAELRYEEISATEETTVIPPVTNAEATGQVAQPAQSQGQGQAQADNAFDAAFGETQVISHSDLDDAMGKTAVIPEPSYPEIVEDPAKEAQQQDEVSGQQPEGYKPLPDGLFAQSPEESVQAQVGTARVQQSVRSVPQTGQDSAVKAAAQQTPAAEENSRPASQAPAPEAKTGSGKETREKSVPSWYKSAKEKAAKDLEARGGENEEDAEKAQPESYRSRYAQIPVSGSMANVRRAMVQEETVAEEKGELSRPPAEKAQDEAATPDKRPASAGQAPAQPATSQPASRQEDAGTKAQDEEPVAVENGQDEKTTEHIDFGFLDDELDDISPDMSGVFAAIEGSETDIAQVVPAIKDPNEIRDDARQPKDIDSETKAGPEQQALREDARDAAEPASSGAAPDGRTGILRGLTSRIPIIGSSDEVEGRPAQSDEAPDSAPAASPEHDERTRQPKPKPERRKPTARHITQEFQPTKPVGERNDENEKLSSMRQEAAVSSTYEDTPQAGPEYDPFVPKDEQPFDAYGNPSPASSAPFPSLSGQGQQGGTGSFPSLGNTSSFPSLSGSFPSLSGQIPQVNPSDFGDSYDVDYGYEPTSDDVADDFGNPNLTGEINIPDSRFHNAMDKVSGLFGHKDKKEKKNRHAKRSKRARQQQEEGYDNFNGGNVDNWDEDDDFGWKGGAYVPDGYGHDDGRPDDGGDGPRAGSALEAAKARAAEIRDSVIEMTERDLLDKEVWFVALGASGAGNQGMKNFLELHGPELRGSLIINLEAVGAGAIHYVESEGTGKPRKCDRRLQSLVRKSSKSLDGVEMRPQKLEWRNTDATPAMTAGLRAMTIMGFDGPAPVAWHWSDDTSDVVDPENLEYVTDLILDMIENS